MDNNSIKHNYDIKILKFSYYFDTKIDHFSTLEKGISNPCIIT